MWRRTMFAVTVMLAVMPASGAAQQVGASFRVSAPAVQPDLVSENTSGPVGLAARVPAGWAWSAQRTSSGAAMTPASAVREPVLATRVAAAGDAGTGRPASETVTWTFVPL